MPSAHERLRSAQGDIYLVSVYPTLASDGFSGGVLAHVAGYYAVQVAAAATGGADDDVAIFRPMLRSGTRRR